MIYEAKTLDEFLRKIKDAPARNHFIPPSGDSYAKGVVLHLKERGLIKVSGDYLVCEITDRGIQLLNSGGFIGAEKVEKKTQRRETRRSRLWEIILCLISAVVGYLLGLIS